MAAIRFYRKLTPETAVPIGGANVIKFPTLDGVLGWYATENEQIQAAFQAHIEAGRGGISEVGWPEFESEYVKKKDSAPPLRRLWREELSASGSRAQSNTSRDPTPRPVAVVTSPRLDDGSRMEESQTNGSPAPTAAASPEAPTEFRPTVGKRV